MANPKFNEENKMSTPNDSVQEMLARSTEIDEENKRFFRDEEHREELEEEYSGHIVAILNGGRDVEAVEFAENGDTIRSFMQDLKERYGEETVDAAYIKYISKPDEVMIL